MMNIEIYDANGNQYRPATRKPVFTKAWQGGEDMTLGFILDRSSALDWPDVGYGYEVVLRSGLDALWSGEIRHIEQDVEMIGITALGNWIYLDDFPYIGGGATPGTRGRLWCDTRWGKWRPVTGDDSVNFAPEKYQMDNQNRLWICPRKGETFGTTDNDEYGGYKYISLCDNIKRVTFNYDFLDPDNWLFQLRSMDANRANQNTEWTLAATAAGAADVTLATPRARLEFSLSYNAADAQYNGETGEDCYGKITNLKVYGTTDITPTVTDVGVDIVAQVQAGTPIENDTTQIETIAVTLEPLFYEQGEMCYEALKDAAYFGDANNQAIGWGVESGRARVFVRAPDRDSVRYVVPTHQARKLSAKGQADKNYASAERASTLTKRARCSSPANTMPM